MRKLLIAWKEAIMDGFLAAMLPVAKWLTEHPKAARSIEFGISVYWTFALIASVMRRDWVSTAFTAWFLYRFLKRGGGWWDLGDWDEPLEPEPDPGYKLNV
jgi:hypothetical protein